MRAFWAPFAVGRLMLGLLTGQALMLASGSAGAQAAADMATARRLAGEGVKLYNDGDYAGALERLERAESLFDAPTHLLFIARAQAKLGRLVESSETYRQLARVNLDAAAPQAFRDAVAQAPKELAELEPTIPLLTLQVTPPGVAGLTLTIDNVPVSAAVIGVERPVNPGKHVIKAQATGYLAQEAALDIAAAGRETVRLELKAQGPVAVGGPVSKADTVKIEDQGSAAEAPPTPPPPWVAFGAGLRIGAVVPSGDVGPLRRMADYYGPGGGVEFDVGLRFPALLKKFDLGVALFYERFAPLPGPKLDELGQRSGTVSNSVSLDNAGFVLRASVKRHLFGPFGELGLSLLHRIQETRDFDLKAVLGPPARPARKCQETTKWEGSSLKVVGGVHFPMATWFSLSPYVSGSFGEFSSMTFTSKCEPDMSKSEKLQSPGRHVLLGVGIGGEFWLGRD